ncbi:unnamed protein product [Anisakis simplex]|uniref:Coiled-coil domain containing 160 n=1 Tax=Anisakis simplex TaxID=6269 RepID=A0A0M3JMZ8_ANISI|nr:unnamed protein product [Anisakis simplex]
MNIFSDELRESKQEVQSTRAILETQKTLCANQEKEICKRRQQLDESVEALEQMREELKEARKKASGLDWKLKERTLKEQIETERLEYTRKITTLEARIKMVQCIYYLFFGIHRFFKNFMRNFF